MFCNKCGNEIKENDLFCTKCGARVGLNGSSANAPIDNVRIKSLETNTILSIISNAVLLILSLVFSMTDVFNVNGILGVSEGMSMFQDMIGTGIFFGFAYLLSAAALVIPWILKKNWHHRLFLPAIIVTILSLIWFLFVLLIGAIEVSSSDLGSLAEFALSATGWLYIVSTITSLIISFKNFFDFKKTITNKNQKNFVTEGESK